MQIFAPILKVDAERRLVIGRATEEVIDNSGEIFDYESSKPLFQAWSADVYKDSQGKSYGNLRAMHQPIAAGRLDDITFNDKDKAIDVVAYVSDDAEWQKVMDGVYTGFSIGGKYAKTWNDSLNGTPAKRYTANPHELSLVDRPCVPTAKFFDVLKRDGSLEKVAFKPNETGTAMTKIDVKKGVYSVASLAQLVCQLESLAMDARWEAQREGDGSTVWQELLTQVGTLGPILATLAIEETQESAALATQPLDDSAGNLIFGRNLAITMAKALQVSLDPELRKAKLKDGDNTLALCQKLHDACSLMGAACKKDDDMSMALKTINSAGDDAMTVNKNAGPPDVSGKSGAPGAQEVQSDNAKVGNSSAKEDDETSDEKEERMKARKKKAAAEAAKSMGLDPEGIAKQISDGINAGFEALFKGLMGSAPAATAPGVIPNAIRPPALRVVGKDGVVNELTKAEDIVAQGAITPVPGNPESPQVKAANLIKAMHARGPDEILDPRSRDVLYKRGA